MICLRRRNKRAKKIYIFVWQTWWQKWGNISQDPKTADNIINSWRKTIFISQTFVVRKYIWKICGLWDCFFVSWVWNSNHIFLTKTNQHWFSVSRSVMILRKAFSYFLKFDFIQKVLAISSTFGIKNIDQCQSKIF